MVRNTAGALFYTHQQRLIEYMEKGRTNYSQAAGLVLKLSLVNQTADVM